MVQFETIHVCGVKRMIQSFICPQCNEVQEYASKQPPKTCPNCQSSLNSQKSFKKQNPNQQWGSFKAFLVLIVFLVGGMIHISKWNEYSLTIIPLKISDFLSMTNVQSLEKIYFICDQRKLLSCQEDTLLKLTQKDPKNRSYLERLAKVQFKMKSPNITLTYVKYMELGKEKKNTYSTETLHLLAQAVESLHKSQEALALYSLVLSDKKYKHKAQATRGYVNLLLSQRKLLQAKRTILDFRKQNKGAQLFLKNELQSIDRKLASARL